MQNPAVEKLGLTIAEAAFASGIGRSRLYEAIGSGQLTARKFGARTVILRSDLNQFLDALPAANGEGKQLGAAAGRSEEPSRTPARRLRKLGRAR